MKKRLILGLGLVMTACMVTGCGIVTVVPVGHEAEYTGATTFDSSAQSSDDWESVSSDIVSQAVDINEAVSAGDSPVAVTGTATVVEFNTDTPKYYLLVEVEGLSGEIKIQAGGVYSGTTIRDVQTVKKFADFTNQTEWSEYAKALNTELDTNVVAPLGLDESVAGKTVTFTGAAEISGDSVTITPVELTIE